MTGLSGPDDATRDFASAVAPGVDLLVDLPALGIELHFLERRVEGMSRSLFDQLWPRVARRDDPRAALVGLLRRKLMQAVYLAGPEEAGYLYELPGDDPDDPIWLMQTERGTWTVMLTSEY